MLNQELMNPEGCQSEPENIKLGTLYGNIMGSSELTGCGTKV
jgi:hypothetical protein